MEQVKLEVAQVNLDAERTVIGSLLVDCRSCSEIFSKISSDDFFDSFMAKIFGIIKQEWEDGHEVSIVTIADKLGEPGASAILTKLTNFAINSGVALQSADIVKEKSILRKIAQASREVLDIVSDPTKSSQEAIEEAERIFMELAKYRQDDLIPIKEAIKEAVARIEKDPASCMGHSSGYEEIDNVIGGLRNGELVVIAARPSVGKTALALNMAYKLAVNEIPVAIFSLEMSSVELATRLISLETEIPIYQLRTGQVRNIRELKVDALAYLESLPIYVDDSSLTSTSQIRSILRRHKEIKVVFIDYIQLMQLEKTFENRVAEVSKIARDLKCIAKEFNIPVIAISQLSRAVEQRQDKRPQLSDLRESGAIEQEADVVLLMYREDYYKKGKEKEQQDIVPVEIEVAKNRNGALKTIVLNFDKKTNRFGPKQVQEVELDG